MERSNEPIIVNFQEELVPGVVIGVDLFLRDVCKENLQIYLEDETERNVVLLVQYMFTNKVWLLNSKKDGQWGSFIVIEGPILEPSQRQSISITVRPDDTFVVLCGTQLLSTFRILVDLDRCTRLLIRGPAYVVQVGYQGKNGVLKTIAGEDYEQLSTNPSMGRLGFVQGTSHQAGNQKYSIGSKSSSTMKSDLEGERVLDAKEKAKEPNPLLTIKDTDDSEPLAERAEKSFQNLQAYIKAARSSYSENKPPPVNERSPFTIEESSHSVAERSIVAQDNETSKEALSSERRTFSLDKAMKRSSTLRLREEDRSITELKAHSKDLNRSVKFSLQNVDPSKPQQLEAPKVDLTPKRKRLFVEHVYKPRERNVSLNEEQETNTLKRPTSELKIGSGRGRIMVEHIYKPAEPSFSPMPRDQNEKQETQFILKQKLEYSTEPTNEPYQEIQKETSKNLIRSETNSEKFTPYTKPQNELLFESQPENEKEATASTSVTLDKHASTTDIQTDTNFVKTNSELPDPSPTQNISQSQEETKLNQPFDIKVLNTEKSRIMKEHVYNINERSGKTNERTTERRRSSQIETSIQWRSGMEFSTRKRLFQEHVYKIEAKVEDSIESLKTQHTDFEFTTQQNAIENDTQTKKDAGQEKRKSSNLEPHQNFVSNIYCKCPRVKRECINRGHRRLSMLGGESTKESNPIIDENKDLTAKETEVKEPVNSNEKMYLHGEKYPESKESQIKFKSAQNEPNSGSGLETDKPSKGVPKSTEPFIVTIKMKRTSSEKQPIFKEHIYKYDKEQRVFGVRISRLSNVNQLEEVTVDIPVIVTSTEDIKTISKDDKIKSLDSNLPENEQARKFKPKGSSSYKKINGKVKETVWKRDSLENIEKQKHSWDYKVPAKLKLEDSQKLLEFKTSPEERVSVPRLLKQKKEEEHSAEDLKGKSFLESEVKIKFKTSSDSNIQNLNDVPNSTDIINKELSIVNNKITTTDSELKETESSKFEAHEDISTKLKDQSETISISEGKNISATITSRENVLPEKTSSGRSSSKTEVRTELKLSNSVKLLEFKTLPETIDSEKSHQTTPKSDPVTFQKGSISKETQIKLADTKNTEEVPTEKLSPKLKVDSEPEVLDLSLPEKQNINAKSVKITEGTTGQENRSGKDLKELEVNNKIETPKSNIEVKDTFNLLESNSNELEKSTINYKNSSLDLKLEVKELPLEIRENINTSARSESKFTTTLSISEEKENIPGSDKMRKYDFTETRLKNSHSLDLEVASELKPSDLKKLEFKKDSELRNPDENMIENPIEQTKQEKGTEQQVTEKRDIDSDVTLTPGLSRSTEIASPSLSRVESNLQSKPKSQYSAISLHIMDSESHVTSSKKLKTSSSIITPKNKELLSRIGLDKDNELLVKKTQSDVARNLKDQNMSTLYIDNKNISSITEETFSNSKTQTDSIELESDKQYIALKTEKLSSESISPGNIKNKETIIMSPELDPNKQVVKYNAELTEPIADNATEKQETHIEPTSYKKKQTVSKSNKDLPKTGKDHVCLCPPKDKEPEVTSTNSKMQLFLIESTIDLDLIPSDVEIISSASSSTSTHTTSKDEKNEK